MKNIIVQTINTISVAELKEMLGSNPYILDVRKRNEVADGAVEGANWIELVHLETDREKVPKDKPVYVNCQSGQRSSIACTILHKHGINNAINIQGGFKAMFDAGFPVKPIK
jgi:hydroxyacylglutathione hydrolase